MTFILRKNRLWQSHNQCIKAGNLSESENDSIAQKLSYLAKIIDLIKTDNKDDSITEKLDYLAKIIDLIKAGNQDAQKLDYLAKIIDLIKAGNQDAQKLDYLAKIINLMKADNEVDLIGNDLMGDSLADAFTDFGYTVFIKIELIAKTKSEAFSALMKEIEDAHWTFQRHRVEGRKDEVDLFLKLFKEKLLTISKKIEESAELSVLEKETLLEYKENILNFHTEALYDVIYKIIGHRTFRLTYPLTN